MKTWNVLTWNDKPEATRPIMLCCPKCGSDARLDIGETPGGIIIAAIGLGIVFDPPGYRPPSNFMPDEIKCRTCRKIFSSLEIADVR